MKLKGQKGRGPEGNHSRWGVRSRGSRTNSKIYRGLKAIDARRLMELIRRDKDARGTESKRTIN